MGHWGVLSQLPSETQPWPFGTIAPGTSNGKTRREMEVARIHRPRHLRTFLPAFKQVDHWHCLSPALLYTERCLPTCGRGFQKPHETCRQPSVLFDKNIDPGGKTPPRQRIPILDFFTSMSLPAKRASVPTPDRVGNTT